MEIERPYCPVCKREVSVATTTAPLNSGGHAPIPDEPRRICLDFGDACDPRPGGVGALRHPGAECALFHIPAIVMGVSRARTGLTPEPRVEVQVYCEGCEEKTVQERVGTAFAFCRLCRSTNLVGSKKRRTE